MGWTVFKDPDLVFLDDGTEATVEGKSSSGALEALRFLGEVAEVSVTAVVDDMRSVVDDPAASKISLSVDGGLTCMMQTECWEYTSALVIR